MAHRRLTIHGLQHVGMHLAKEVSKDPKKAAASAVTAITVAAPYILGAAAIAGVGYVAYKVFKK